MLDFNTYQETEEKIISRIDKIVSASFSDEEKKTAYQTILSCTDLTSLEGNDHYAKIAGICQQAKSFSEQGPEIPNVAAVCFYTPFIGTAKRELANTGIRIATVAAGFPSGQIPLALKVAECEYAVSRGAHEVDIVISRGKIIEGFCQELYDEICTLKKACDKATMKVILETGELETIENIRKASEISIMAGADFLKTSTGKIKPAATPRAFLIMLDTIKEYYEGTGKMVGIKAAGGIAEPADALVYFSLVNEILGEAWLDKKYFRIGASKLAQKLADGIKRL